MLANTIKIKELRFHIRNSLFFLICFTGGICNAQTLELTPRLTQAYEHILSLEFDEGRRLLNQEKEENSDNYLTYHFENYIDFFTCFISEEEAIFEVLSDNKKKRIDLIESANENSPYYLFSQAEILLQWALVKLKFEEYFTAIWDINKAIRLLEKNEKKFPSFIANKKSLSALHALVGTIPSTYKYLLQQVSSFNGTIDQGYGEIKEVLQNTNEDSFLFYKESVAIKALIELHLLNDKSSAYKTISIKAIDEINNPLACFIKSNISHKAGYNDEAIDMLQNYLIQPREQFPMYYLNYQLGIYKLNRLDEDSDFYIKKYLHQFKGRNYIKEAYQKLAWHEWVLNNSKDKYKIYMDSCRLRGYDILDEDKQAKKLSLEGHIPAGYLLKARLLSDGGYYEKALTELLRFDDAEKIEVDLIEHHYRSGRIYQELDKEDEAEQHYLLILKRPNLNTHYYQTSASLHLAQLYEKQGFREKAMEYYEKCLNMNPKQYKSSLHQKAKAGIQRINY